MKFDLDWRGANGDAMWLSPGKPGKITETFKHPLDFGIGSVLQYPLLEGVVFRGCESDVGWSGSQQ